MSSGKISLIKNKNEEWKVTRAGELKFDKQVPFVNIAQK